MKLFADNLALDQIIGFVCAERKNQGSSPLPAVFSLAFCLRALNKGLISYGLKMKHPRQ